MKYRRREFISVLGCTALATSLMPRGIKAYSPGPLGDTRTLFQLDPGVIHLNAAHLCPMPREVVESLASFNREIDSNPSSEREYALLMEKERVRERLGESVGASSADEIALVRNTTEGNNIIINGLDLSAGDEIVIWDQNHQSNNIAWKVRAARHGLRVNEVRLPPVINNVDDILTAFARAINKKTRVLSITHISNVSGFRLPVDALCGLAKNRNIFVHVDGAQSWGVMSLDLKKMGCDSFTGSAHKWFMGPREVGLLYVRAGSIKRLWPGVVGLDWGKQVNTELTGARKFESFGQRDDGSLAAMSAALDFRERFGEKTIASYARDLAVKLKVETDKLGLQHASPAESTFSGPILILTTPPNRRKEVATTLYKKYGINISTKGGIRFSPHIYNSPADIDYLLNVLQENRHWFSS